MADRRGEIVDAVHGDLLTPPQHNDMTTIRGWNECMISVVNEAADADGVEYG